MTEPLLQGKLVRLAAEDIQTLAEKFSFWGRDSEYMRLLDSYPPLLHSVYRTRQWLEKELLKETPDFLFFTIRTLEDDRLIGDVDISLDMLNHGNSYVGIGIGDRQYWGKGYGTDAMRILLRYAFAEVNLHRVSLNVFEYNERAIRSYEKAGFQIEGRLRQWINREGRRWDLMFMGITRQEWLSQVPVETDTVRI